MNESDGSVIKIQGGTPLVGDIQLSGSRNLAIALCYASLLSDESCTLGNVPFVDFLSSELGFLENMGVVFSRLGSGKISVSSATLKSSDVDCDADQSVNYFLAIPALIHKFGKARVPVYKGNDALRGKIEAFHTILTSFGLEVAENEGFLEVGAKKMSPAELNLPFQSRTLTQLAILTGILIPGESVIDNASADIEVDDLIEFCVGMGAEIKRIEENKIVLNGVNVLKQFEYQVPFDREEAVFYSSCALLTRGNIIMTKVDRARLFSFLNWLSKIGGNYELSQNELRIWESGTGLTNPSSLKIAPWPGFITDWSPLATLIYSLIEGESEVIESHYASNLEYIPELNSMGAKIDLENSDKDLHIKIIGSTVYNGGRAVIKNSQTAAVLVCSALCAQGETELLGYDLATGHFSGLTEKLLSLGASVL